MLICLQQEDRRIRRKDGGGENLPIGFEVLKVRGRSRRDDNDVLRIERLTNDDPGNGFTPPFQVEVNRCSRVQCVGEQAASSVYMDSRSVALRVQLAPGRYALLPTTFQPGPTGHFLLRLFSQSHVSLRCVWDVGSLRQSVSVCVCVCVGGRTECACVCVWRGVGVDVCVRVYTCVC